MTKSPINSSGKPSGKSSARQDRLAAALRANLKRRKAQIRGKARAKADVSQAGDAAPEVGAMAPAQSTPDTSPSRPAGGAGGHER